MTTTEQPPNRQRLWQPGSEAEVISFGTWLRRQRELREISLREIADVTKISVRYLEALEQDRFDVLPAPVFAKGFLREYARYVGLDPDEVVNSYLTAQQSLEPEEEPAPRGGRPKASLERTSGLLLVAGVVALLGIVAGLSYYAERSRDKTELEPPPMAAPPVPVVVETEVPSETGAVVQAALLVTIDFTGDCWVEAVIDDSRRISELHVPGESLRLEADQRVVLTLGNPDGVRVEVNGHAYPISAPAGAVARDIEIDLATVGTLKP